MSPLQPIGHTAYHHVGQDNQPQGQLWKLISIGAVGLAAFHGYRRNRSVGWAIGWALLAGFSPVITTGVAVAQGLGKRKGA